MMKFSCKSFVRHVKGFRGVYCKVIEHIIHSHLMKFFEDQNILTDYQHGFRKKRSLSGT
jgi:hypothetical protein